MSDAVHCPSLNIFGTFFPSWMLCALIGVAVAAVAAKLIGRAGLRAELGPPLVVYPAIGLTSAFLIWLFRYGS
jgi:cytosine/uracil/thiamine/allantoin permease